MSIPADMQSPAGQTKQLLDAERETGMKRKRYIIVKPEET